MAISDTYLTVAEYKQATNTKTSGNDLHIQQVINASCRYIDKICRRHFSQDENVTTRIYDGDGSNLARGFVREDGRYVSGSSMLLLQDDISTIVGLVVTIDNDGDYIPEATLTLNTDYWVGPYNTSLSETEPYTWLRLIPTNNVTPVWPNHMRSISITAKFGWVNIPDTIKEACLILTREIIDLQTGGVTQALNLVDAALPIQRRTAAIVDKLVEEYKRKVKLFV